MENNVDVLAVVCVDDDSKEDSKEVSIHANQDANEGCYNMIHLKTDTIQLKMIVLMEEGKSFFSVCVK